MSGAFGEGKTEKHYLGTKMFGAFFLSEKIRIKNKLVNHVRAYWKKNRNDQPVR